MLCIYLKNRQSNTLAYSSVRHPTPLLRASVDVARRIQYAFEKIARQFGFQPDSLANQHEHVLLLLANTKRETLDSWDQVSVQ